MVDLNGIPLGEGPDRTRGWRIPVTTQRDWLCFLMALAPLTVRTPSRNFGGESLQYLLLTDFILYLLIGLAMLEKRPAFFWPKDAFRVRLLTIGFLGLTVMRYASILLGSLAGDSFVAYLFSGSLWIQPLLVICLAATLIRTENDLARMRKGFMAGAAATVAIGFLEMLRVPAVLDFLNSFYGTATHVEAALHAEGIQQFRLTSTFDRNPHGFALHLMMSITWVTALLSAPGGLLRRRSLLQVPLLLGSAVMLAGTVSTLGLVATLLSVVYVLTVRNRRNLILIAGLLLVIGGLTVVFLAQMESASYRKLTAILAMVSGGEAGPSSFTDRWLVWSTAWERLKDSPVDFLFGLPYRTIVQDFIAKDLGADSDYLNVLLYQGFLGLLAFMALCRGLFPPLRPRTLPGTGEVDSFILAARGMLIGLLAAGLAGGFLTGSGTAWRTGFIFYSFIGAAIGLSRPGVPE